MPLLTLWTNLYFSVFSVPLENTVEGKWITQVTNKKETSKTPWFQEFFLLVQIQNFAKELVKEVSSRIFLSYCIWYYLLWTAWNIIFRSQFHGECLGNFYPFHFETEDLTEHRESTCLLNSTAESMKENVESYHKLNWQLKHCSGYIDVWPRLYLVQSLPCLPEGREQFLAQMPMSRAKVFGECHGARHWKNAHSQ